ncbi:NUDIX hydrolase [Vibrio nereis]|uniref:NUDIX hydrolase n=1 Tax=Vibrio nereis TaxID=693 RepID=UPI0024956543|nr:NUDIX hydrolase [Vibrio nereis]
MTHLSMAVVVRNGKVLVQERYRPSKGMVVEFPGGEVNENETGTDAAIRELSEETQLEGLKHLATFAGINEFGGRIYYAVFEAGPSDQPMPVGEERRQTFKWLEYAELPLDEFYAADVNFIKTQLTKFCKQESAVA